MSARARLLKCTPAVLGFIVASAVLSSAQTLTVLHYFQGADGQNPGAVILDAAGNIYGETPAGGNISICGGGCGNIFRIAASSKEFSAVNFQGTNGNGINGPLARNAKGDLFGTAYMGGVSNLGTIFEADTQARRILFFSFGSGGEPVTGVVLDAEGNLYGTMTLGGASGAGGIFELTPEGKYSLLYSFSPPMDGYFPTSLTMGPSDRLYGTNGNGGVFGGGTIFSLDKAGKFTVLYSFTGGTDGGYPLGPLLFGANGEAYGVAGSSYPGEGLIFQFDKGGTETVLYTFEGDGGFPNGGLVADPEGNLYGTTFGTGDFDGGLVFELAAGRDFEALYKFTNGSSGYAPGAGLARDSSGTLYGTTIGGGEGDCYDGLFNGCGVVFKLVP
jgi:uncharacterized repeat protein (TIGR03803 family)